MLGSLGVKKDSEQFTIKLFNKKVINKTCVIKYFIVATAFVFYCDAKHS